MKGEKEAWVAYLLWFTLFGHRWYLGKISPVYVLTFGYFGIVWLADLFRIPGMVQEYNSHAYRRNLATRSAGETPGILISGQPHAYPGPPPDGATMARSPGSPGSPAPRGETQGVAGGAAPGTVANAPAQPDSRPGGANPLSSPPPGEIGGQPAGPPLGGIPPAASSPLGPWWKKLVLALGVAVIALTLIIAILSGRGSGGGKAVQSPEARETVVEEVPLPLTITTPGQQTVNAPAFAIEGRTEAGASVTVSGAVASPITVLADAQGGFRAEVTLLEGPNLLTVASEKEGRRAERSLTVTYQIDPAQYKAQCQPVEFRVLEKNPDALKGRKYYATGEVVQIMEGALQTDIRLNVTRNSCGFWEDTIYVVYEGNVPAYEDSIIKVWGEIGGSYSYTSTAGWHITLPLVKAKYIEVVQQ